MKAVAMKTIALTKPSRDIRRLLDVAKNEDVVIELPDGELFMLSPVDDFEYEIAQQRKKKKLTAFLEKRFSDARQEKGIPLEEAERLLGLPPWKGKQSKTSRNGAGKKKAKG